MLNTLLKSINEKIFKKNEARCSYDGPLPPSDVQAASLCELYRDVENPHAERSAARVISLPMHPYLKIEDQQKLSSCKVIAMNRWLESVDRRFWILFLGVVALYFQQIWVPGFSRWIFICCSRENAAEHGHWLVPKLSDLTLIQFDQHPIFFLF